MNRSYRYISYMLAVAFMMPSGAVAYDAVFQTGVKNEVLNAFELPVPEKPAAPKEKKEGFAKLQEDIKKLWTEQLFPAPKNSERDRLEMAFALLPSSLPVAPSPVLDLELLTKLEILHGGTDGSQSLVRKLTTIGMGQKEQRIIYTAAGLKSFTELISMPVTDASVLKQRQTIIKELMHNNKLRAEMIALCENMKIAEPHLYELFQKDGLSAEDQMLFPGTIMTLARLNEAPAAISAANFVYRAYPIFVQALTIIFGYYYTKMISAGAEVSDRQKEVAAKITAGASGLLQIYPMFAQFGEIKGEMAAIANFQRRLINVAAYVRSAQALIKSCANDKNIKSAMPDLHKWLLGYVNNTAGNARFRKLLELLQSPTFDGPQPSMMSSPGKILVAYKLISEKETRAHFARLFEAVGQLEAYLAIAQKMKAHENSGAPFCFVDFDVKSTKPFVDGRNIWNPFIPMDKAIGNDFALNTGSERDMLLTGPNTSGKSTFIKSVMMSLMMAQSFGVAPAQSLHMTPFAKLLSYMSIQDNVAAGISQFKAETIRAGELRRVVMGLKPHEFAFFILDEIFTGTAPEQAEKLSYDFISNLTKFPSVLFINATHFKKLAALEQETSGVIKNYHLGAIVDENGRVTSYTRKLVPGVAQYSSAEQVAKEAGITQTWEDAGSW